MSRYIPPEQRSSLTKQRLEESLKEIFELQDEWWETKACDDFCVNRRLLEAVRKMTVFAGQGELEITEII
jgi:hypothetical protein